MRTISARSAKNKTESARSPRFPLQRGGGIARLRAAGIEGITGVLEAEARSLNAPFLHRIANGRPRLGA